MRLAPLRRRCVLFLCLLPLVLACSEPRCRPDELKVGTVCVRRPERNDAGHEAPTVAVHESMSVDGGYVPSIDAAVEIASERDAARELALVELSAGSHSTCAVLSSGSVWCWGRGEEGELGDGFTLSRNAPVAVAGLERATSVSVGTLHACALLADGTVRCWGANARGQLGDGSTTASALPVEVVGLNHVVQLSAGVSATCALLDTGLYACWGDLGSARLQLVPRTFSSTEPVVQVGLDKASGGCAREASGAVFCWSGDWRPAYVPGITATQLSVGRDGACALRPGARVTCWDRASSDAGTSWAAHAAVIAGAVDVQCGYRSACARARSGAVTCWGRNELGNAGTGALGADSPPTEISGLSATAITVGPEHACARTTTGAAVCWGNNSHGAIGAGMPLFEGSKSVYPTQVVGIP